MRNAKYEIQNTKYRMERGGRSLRSLNGFAGGAAHCVR